MRDGVKIAVDVMRPKDVAVDIKLPTILIMARYWRSFALRGFSPQIERLLGHATRYPISSLPMAMQWLRWIPAARGLHTALLPIRTTCRKSRITARWLIGSSASHGQMAKSAPRESPTKAQPLSC